MHSTVCSALAFRSNDRRRDGFRNVGMGRRIHEKLWRCLPLSLAFFCAVAAAIEPLPMPKPDQNVAAKSIKAVEQDVAALSPTIGGYPPRIDSEQTRANVYAQWSAAAQQAWRIEASAPEAESTLVLLSELYRQGHNLDVSQSGERADQTLTKCLSKYPNSIPCHFSASYFYLSVDPRFAPKGEASLLRLRELLKPEVNIDVERGFVFAHLYQGRKEEAVKQIDYLLTLDPNQTWAKELRDGMVKGGVEVVKP